MPHYSAAHFEFMRAETKPPGGFVISPEIPAVLDNMVISRTLCGFASEQSVKFPGSGRDSVPGLHWKLTNNVRGVAVTEIWLIKQTAAAGR